MVRGRPNESAEVTNMSSSTVPDPVPRAVVLRDATLPLAVYFVTLEVPSVTADVPTPCSTVTVLMPPDLP